MRYLHTPPERHPTSQADQSGAQLLALHPMCLIWFALYAFFAKPGASSYHSLHMKIVASDSKTARELGIPDVPPNRRYDYAGCEMTEEINEQNGSTIWTVKHKWVASDEQSQAA
jgi:hypothetical protein